MRRVAKLAIPGTIAASGTQFNILISQSLASFETGAKTWLQFADRFYQLPLGLVGVAVGIAILPRLARSARSDDSASATRTMDEGIGLAMALTVPAAIALLLIPYLFVADVFVRGNFTYLDAERSAQALMHFAWGIPAFVLVKVLAPAFFAREDTVTPMRFALVSVGFNTVLGAGLFLWLRSQDQLGFPGLAIATSTAAWINVILLVSSLHRKNIYTPGPHLISRVVRVMLASGLMAAALLYLASRHGDLIDFAFDRKEGAILLIVAGAGAVYGIAALLFGAVRFRELAGILRRS